MYRHCSQALSKGFILVATLWLLAAATLAMGFFAAWVSRATDRAVEIQTDTQAAVAMLSTRETLLFLAATNPMTHRGIGLYDASALIARRDNFESLAVAGNEIILDGRGYQGLAGTRFAAQDEAGLLNLNQAEYMRQELDSLLRQLGVEADERGRMIAALRDYTQHGSGRSVLGPSRQEYRESGRPLPLNRPLINSAESWRILGWDRHPELWRERRLANLTTVLHYGGLNVNTAPREVLQAFTLLGEQGLQALIEARQGRGFVTDVEAQRHGGLPMGADLFRFVTVPSRHFRLTLWHPETGRGARYYITLTPGRSGAGPWLVDHVYPVSGAEIAGGADPAEVASPLFTSPNSSTRN